MKYPEILEKYRSEIDTEIKAVVDDYRMPLYDMMRYHFGWIDEKGERVKHDSGKALRPALCLYSCEAVGENYRKALPAAAALELVHNFSLIHDDIQDDDKERRHRPTVWSIWGKPQAINAGSAMRILANAALNRFDVNGISPEKIRGINSRLDEISLRLIEGQYLDISFEERPDIKLNDYLMMIDRKTAALISGSMEIGASLGTDDEITLNRFGDIGRNLGMAFQIRDDILGVWGKQEETGKPSGNDIRRRKKSFPVVYAMENVDSVQRKELVDCYQNDTMDDESVTRVMGIFESACVRDVAHQRVRQYCEEAEKILNQLEISTQLKSEMDKILTFLCERNS